MCYAGVYLMLNTQFVEALTPSLPAMLISFEITVKNTLNLSLG